MGNSIVLLVIALHITSREGQVLCNQYLLALAFNDSTYNYKVATLPNPDRVPAFIAVVAEIRVCKSICRMLTKLEVFGCKRPGCILCKL